MIEGIDRHTLEALQAIDRDFALARFDQVIERADALGPAGGLVAQAMRLAAAGLRLEAEGERDGAATLMEQALALGVTLPHLLKALEHGLRRAGRDQLAHHAFLMRDLLDPVATEGDMYALPDDQRALFAPWAIRRSMTARDPDLYGVADFKGALNERHGPEGAAMMLAAISAPDAAVRRATSMTLRPLMGYAQERGEAYSEAIPAATVTARWPEVFGEAPRPAYEARSRTLFSARLDRMVVTGKSNVLLAPEAALHDVQGDELERIPVDLLVDPLISARDGDDVVVSAPADRDTVRRVPEAIWLGGVHSGAFGHWIAEFLPKVWALLTGPVDAGIPILVDRQMPRQHLQALRFFAGPIRPIVVEPGEQVRVDRLWIASQLVYMPVGPLPGSVARPGDGVIDAAGLRRLMEPLQDRLEAADGASEWTNVYLSRPEAGRRRLEDRDAVEAVLRRHGYRSFGFEQLDFAQQVRVIRGAERVVGPDGSALMMTIFGRPGLRVGLFSHPYLEEFEWYIQASAAQSHDVSVLAGSVTREDPSYRTFSDYRVDAEALDGFLIALEKAGAT